MMNLLEAWGNYQPSTLTQAINDRRNAGLPLQDFIDANPWDYGVQYDPKLLQTIFAKAVEACACHSKDATEGLAAREAVVEFLADPKATPDRIILTPGTSMSYFYLLRLLSRAGGGEILCPTPSCPHFEDLAAMAGLRVQYYHLTKTITSEGLTRWIPDLEDIVFQISQVTRAIIVVSPHTPTGTIVNHDEMTAICEIANHANLTVILDEAFRDYVRDDTILPTPRLEECGCELGYTLNSLDQSHNLPCIRAGWIQLSGNKGTMGRQWHQALQHFANKLMPVSEVTQLALPRLLSGPGLEEMNRLKTLKQKMLTSRISRLQTSGLPVNSPEAGPYITLTLPETTYDEALALKLIEEHGTIFHPGSFFNMPGYLVGTIYNDAEWPANSVLTMDNSTL